MRASRLSGLAWQPDPTLATRIDALARSYRHAVRAGLDPLVTDWHPGLGAASSAEYPKMLELTTKMTLVAHACTEIAGETFDARRQRIAILFGCCCFLADSFLDDFGAAATGEYLRRFATLLHSGWFELRTERERLFYVVLARLFAERNVLDPVVRQSIVRLHAAQERDVMLRLEPDRVQRLPPARRRALLKRTARDRSGHAIIALTSFLVPSIPLDLLGALFAAGALIMFIDDHGDCFADLQDGRLTYMNQLRQPERALDRIASAHFLRLHALLPENSGRDLLLGFLYRYYVTRIEKHRLQRRRGGTAWDVYE